jgi:hypothetical protein
LRRKKNRLKKKSRRGITTPATFFRDKKMAGQKTISATYKETVTPPAADYHVTGTLSPDATGDYFYGGMYGGLPYYKNKTKNFWIYSDAFYPDYWMSNALGYTGGGAWHKMDAIVTGLYEPLDPNTGEATVETGPG